MGDSQDPTISVYVLGKPRIEQDIWRFLTDNNLIWRRTPGATEAEELVELAGRICYMSFGEYQSNKTTAEYIRHLIKNGHHSVLEHASWTLLVEGISRAFTHQLVRHRIGFSFSQLSQQYHNESNSTFIPPHEIVSNPAAHAIWLEHMHACRDAYLKLTEILPQGLLVEPNKEKTRSIRSAARSVLPSCTETKIAVSANARALRHFLSIRGGIEGDSEMRFVSAKLLEAVRIDAPSIFYDFTIEYMNDGSPIVKHDPEYMRQ